MMYLFVAFSSFSSSLPSFFPSIPNFVQQIWFECWEKNDEQTREQFPLI